MNSWADVLQVRKRITVFVDILQFNVDTEYH